MQTLILYSILFGILVTAALIGFGTYLTYLLTTDPSYETIISVWLGDVNIVDKLVLLWIGIVLFILLYPGIVVYLQVVSALPSSETMAILINRFLNVYIATLGKQ
jgi:hypothetical protein